MNASKHSLAILLFASIAAYSQPSSSANQARLKQADKVTSKGKGISLCIGNVIMRVENDSATIYADQVVFDKHQKTLVIIGKPGEKARFVNGNLIVSADTIRYDLNTRKYSLADH